MSTQHFPPEFKEEAVKQITEHCYPVAEVASRLGVSAHSLYQWLKCYDSKRAKPAENEKEGADFGPFYFLNILITDINYPIEVSNLLQANDVIDTLTAVKGWDYLRLDSSILVMTIQSMALHQRNQTL